MHNAEMTTEIIHAPDGCKIFLRMHNADNERARLVLAHGLGEHSGRYQNLVDPLLSSGISFWAPDHRGHGQSDGQRGHITAFDQYINDLLETMNRARETLPASSPLFLMGHSMGGLIALRFAQQFPQLASGVVVSSPALGLTVKVPAIKGLLGKVMSSLWPGLSLGNELDATKISHDPQVITAYMDDPLVHDRVSARWFTEFLNAMAKAHQQAGALVAPLLMQLAGDDHLTDSNAARAFFDGLALEDKTLHWYDNLYHEIYNEPLDQRSPIIDTLINWLDTHMDTTDQ